MGIDNGDGLFVEGDQNAPILVICEPPDEHAFAAGRAMTGPERKFFEYVADSYGFSPEQFCYLPCAFPMPESAVGDKDQADHLARDRDEFLSLLVQCRPEMILVLGKHALRQLSGRAAQIGKARGQLYAVPGVRQPVLPMFGVRHCLWYPDAINIFVSDFNMLATLDDNDYNPACLERATDENTDYQWTLDLSEFFEAKPAYMAVDTETTGLKWTDPKVRVLTVQLTTAPGMARCVPVDMRAARIIFPDMPERELARAVTRAKLQITTLLTDPSIRKIGHNLKFDHHQIRESLGVKVRGWFADTQQLAFVADDNMFEKSLNEVTRRWVPEMAGYCLAPWTNVLTADMRHVRADSVREGDELATFDEEPKDGNRRRLRAGKVTSVVRRQRPRFEVTTETGKVLTVSADHQFLARGKGGKWRWRKAKDMTVGTRLHPFPWAQAGESYDAGYMGGILDGEGWSRKVGDGGAFRLGFAQKPGMVFDRATRILAAAGYTGWTRRTDDRAGVMNVELDGHQSLRALQEFQPARLIGKRSWVGACLHAGDGEAITAIRYVGMGEVVSISTTERTLIAEGICQHNCDAFDATSNKADMLGELRKDPARFLRYAGGDTDANYRAARALVKLAQEDEQNWKSYLYIQLPALLAFADKVEPTGLNVDLTRLAELEEQVGRETEEIHNRVLSQIPAVIRRRHLKAGLRLSRADFKIDALFSPEGLNLTPIKFTKGTTRKTDAEKVPSTSAKEHLIYFANEPLVEGIMRWTKLDKMRGTYVGKEFDPDKGGPTGFWQHVVRKGDETRIHPSFFLHRTRTGRSASADPNAQNFPKRGDLAKSFRSIFVAPPGYKIIEADLSQAELRIAACQANERRMIQLYNEGVDIHANTGAIITGNRLEHVLANKKSEDLLLDRANEFHGAGAFLQRLNPGSRKTATVADFIAQIRYQAKAVNFGFLYGMQWFKFMIYAKTDYGIDYTEQEAMMMRERFFEAYPGLIDWHASTEREVYANGCVRALHGAIRRLPAIYSTQRSIQSEAVRQGINSPIQRFASDLGIMALWRLSRDCPDYIKPVAFIHDALVAYVREDKVQEGGSAIRWYMENNPLQEWFGLNLQVPILADVSVGDRMSDVKEVKMDSVCPSWFRPEMDHEAIYAMA